MSVLDACVTYLFMYTQYLFLHVKIIWEKKNIQLLQIKQILPLQAFQEKFPDQISLYMTECQICPQAQFWMTNFKHVEMITPWLTTAPVQLKCSHNFCFCNRGSTRMRPSPEQHSTGTNSRYQTIYYRLLEAPASDLLLLSLEICG